MSEIATPYYEIDFSQFSRNCRQITNAFIKEWGENIIFGYSVKTNNDVKLIEYANKNLGWFIETVSPYEYSACKENGISENEMILNGPCKGKMLFEAVNKGAYVNLDNLDEVQQFCSQRSISQIDRIGLRVNFDLEKKCPNETTAGKEVSRFGIDCESPEFAQAIDMLKSVGVSRLGLHMHTSTKTRSCAVFQEIAKQVLYIRNKYNVELSYIDIGGGFFGGQLVEGKPTMEDYAREICGILKSQISPVETRLILEPGASVLATCVSYKTSIINVRKIRGQNVVTLDGTLLHINPFMSPRNQPFDIENISEMSGRKCMEKQILCGCTCMENDRFGEMIGAKELKRGDILSFKYAGAYTMVFNSSFILKPPVRLYVKKES